VRVRRREARCVGIPGTVLGHEVSGVVEADRSGRDPRRRRSPRPVRRLPGVP
jgi:hypothetical protein